MSLRTLEDVAASLARKYLNNAGFFELCTPASYPIEISLSPPSSKQLVDNFSQVKKWNQALEFSSWRKNLISVEVNNRIIGSQVIFSKIKFNSPTEIERFILEYLPRKDKSLMVTSDLSAFGGPKVKLGTFEAFYTLCNMVAKPLYPKLDPSSPAFKTRLSGVQSFMSTQAHRAAMLGNDLLIALQFVDFIASLEETPCYYLRQFSLPHMHSKFLEQNMRLIDQLLILCLPVSRQKAFVVNPRSRPMAKADIAEEVEESAGVDAEFDLEQETKGLNRILMRWGFKLKPELIRMRSLDPERISCLDAGQGFAALEIRATDISMEVDAFNAWQPSSAIKHVIVCENEICYLSLPQISNTIAIWGAGYKALLLGRLPALAHMDVLYWGDLDTHGFAILSKLRSKFYKLLATQFDTSNVACFDPLTDHDCASLNVRSFLMDIPTMEANLSNAVVEGKPFQGQLNFLTSLELKAYQALLNNDYGENVRIEQEFIPFSMLLDALIQALPDEVIVKPEHYC